MARFEDQRAQLSGTAETALHLGVTQHPASERMALNGVDALKGKAPPLLAFRPQWLALGLGVLFLRLRIGIRP